MEILSSVYDASQHYRNCRRSHWTARNSWLARRSREGVLCCYGHWHMQLGSPTQISSEDHHEFIGELIERPLHLWQDYSIWGVTICSLSGEKQLEAAEANWASRSWHYITLSTSYSSFGVAHPSTTRLNLNVAFINMGKYQRAARSFRGETVYQISSAHHAFYKIWGDLRSHTVNECFFLRRYSLSWVDSIMIDWETPSFACQNCTARARFVIRFPSSTISLDYFHSHFTYLDASWYSDEVWTTLLRARIDMGLRRCIILHCYSGFLDCLR